MFIKAERRQAKLRLALCGPSGSGKTLGALLIAKGLGGKIAMIDTERGSGSLYSDKADYDVCQLAPPFSPEAYIKAIKDAENNNYDVLIIDSLSHAWNGIGGVLEMHDKATRASKSQNSYFAWGEVTPHQNRLIETILQSKMHIIVCMRVKTEYAVADVNGKKAPIKIGLAPIQRDGVEYEFTCVLDLMADSHIYRASKDRTEIFEGKSEVLSITDGEKLNEWLNSGKDITTTLNYIENSFSECATLETLKIKFEETIHSYPSLQEEIIKLKDDAKNKLIMNQDVNMEAA
jgi:hypothetical protein